jgi:hypothetical protein
MSLEQLAELRGLAKGILIDGDVSPAEANALCQWLVSNSELLDVAPCDRLGARLCAMIADSKLDEAESEELRGLLRQLLIAFDERDRATLNPHRATYHG